MRNILGISAFYHDSAAAIIVDGNILAAAQEERFTRVKNTAEFPVQAIKYCLEESGLGIDDLDAVVFYDKPFLKFERLLQTYYAFAPRGIVSFLKAIPIWLREKLFLKNAIYKGLEEVGIYEKRKLNLLFSEHHLSHAASAFYATSFEKAAILTIDGVGEWCTASISVGEGTSIKMLKEMEFPHSVGLLYSAFTYYLGFKVNSGEYKLMGLAPYGDPSSKETKNFIEIIKSKLVDIKKDGSIWLNQTYFTYATGLKMVPEKKWYQLFGFRRRLPETSIEQKHCNLALAIQTVTEEIVLKMAREAKRLSHCDNLCLAGGVALNCVANGKLLQEGIFKNFYIQPAPGDAGAALGAAWAVHYLYFDGKRKSNSNDLMKGSYLGPEFSEKDIQRMNRKTKAVYTGYDQFTTLCEVVANKIAEGKIVGWFQGRMEFGPRALGNRSILGDPRNPEMQKKINLRIKEREEFRPFAPAVLEEDASKYFELEVPSPYMMFVAPVKQIIKKVNLLNHNNLSLLDRLYLERGDLQPVTHVDYSARIQTVHKETNPRFWELLSTFKKRTGYGLLINTSFNVRGEPMVCTPYDAYRCFMATEMDYLVINNCLYNKQNQPDKEKVGQWRKAFTMD